MTLLTVMKGLPLAYNKDMQEDKEAIFDSVQMLIHCLTVFIPMFKTIRLLPEHMYVAAAKGFMNATDVADYLVKKGLAFRDAYKISGQLVAYCVETNTILEELPLNIYKLYSSVFERDLYDAINLKTCTFARNSQGASSIGSVNEQIKKLLAKS